jgi:ketosteroid isomerase-like protein
VTDAELRVLCHRFFDALERADIDTIAKLYAPGMQLWVNVTGKEISADENLAVLRDGAKLHRRRTYDDRTINTFDTGFVVQYSVNVVAHSGKRTSLSACVIAQCRDGKITRLDEYLDAGKFAPRARADLSTEAQSAEGASA